MKKLAILLILIAATAHGALTRMTAVSEAGTGITVFPSGYSTANGDIIVIWAYNSGGTTIPTLPADYTNIVGTAGTQQAARCGYKFSTGGETSSLGWTNATNLSCLVYSGALGIGTTPTIAAGSSTTISYSAVTLTVTTGSSVILGFAAIKTGAGNDMTGNPSGGTVPLIYRTASGLVAAYDSAATAANYTAQTKTLGATSRWQSVTFELKAATSLPYTPINAPSTGTFLPF